MHYAAIKELDIANGPGVRVSLFVSGCRRHCKGCFNQETWDFNYGKEFTSETLQELERLLSNEHVTGLSILGGDPCEPENREAVLDICKHVRETFGDSKTIWMWSGYLWEDLVTGLSTLGGDPCEPENREFGDSKTIWMWSGYLWEDLRVLPVMKYIDVLVDGPFVERWKDLSLYFRGSQNQRVIDVPASLKAGYAVRLKGDWK